MSLQRLPSRNPSPRDGSDEDGALVAPSLPRMRPDAPQRAAPVRAVVHGLR